MSTLSFGKYQGAGNDFILIDDRSFSFPTAESSFIQRLCDRKFGIGADGLILLQNDSEVDFKMRIFNADGTEAEGCGNGLRCLARFAADLGLPEKPYKIRTGDRIVSVDYWGDRIRVEMGAASDLKLHLSTEQGPVHFANTGVPHAVLFVSDVEQVPIQELGSILRHHSLFHPKGANANFASLQPDGSIRVRTFERGVEGETLACGTGACAVAAIAKELYSLSNTIPIDFPGGRLEIHFNGDSIQMIGPAERVFIGTL